MSEKVRGLVHDGMAADATVTELLDAEFEPNEITVSEADERPRPERGLVYRSADKVGVLTGGAIGAVAGAVVAGLVVYGGIEADWLEAFLGVSLASALFRGALVGACFGALWGGIAFMGWWTQKAPVESHERGAFVVAVTAEPGQVDVATKILERRGKVLASVAATENATPVSKSGHAARSGDRTA